MKNLWNTWKIPLLVALIGGNLWLFSEPYFFNQGTLVSSFSDYWDYAQQGRQIASGKGFSSLYTYPVLISHHWFKDFPNLWRPPGYPVLAALSYSISGNSSLPLIWIGGLFHFLTILLIVRFFNLYSKSQWGWIAGLLYSMTPMILKLSLSGLSEPVFAFFVTFFLYQCYQASQLESIDWKLGVNLAFFFAAGWYIRSEMIFLLLPVLWYFQGLSWKNKPDFYRFTGAFIGMTVLLMSPWWVRNYQLTGNPWFNMSNALIIMFTPKLQGWYYFRNVIPDTSVSIFILHHPVMILTKTGHYLLSNLKNILMLHAVMVPLFVLGYFIKDKDEASRFDLFVLGSLLFFLAGISLMQAEPRFFYCLFPVMLIMAVTVIYQGIKAFQVHRRFSEWYIWIPLLLLCSVPMIQQFAYIKPLSAKILKEQDETAWTPLLGVLPERENTVLLTDVPDYLSYRVGVRTMWLPLMRELPSALKYEPRIKGIYLTKNIMKMKDDPDIRMWKRVYLDSGPIPGFVLAGSFYGGSLYYKRVEVSELY